MTIPIVAIIGLPNTGKSTFFNKVMENKKALTFPEAGTTRDRAYGLTVWNGFSFYLVDTAGIVARPDSDLEKNVQKQTQIAKDEADLIILVVDGRSPVGTADLQIATMLNQSKKPALLAVNKVDVRNTKTETGASVYQKLGLGTPFLTSSINGIGIGDLLDAVVEKLKKQFPPQDKSTETGLRFAFIGKPNVGKSSLVNALLKQERVLVHHTAGTTRSTVEIPFEHAGQKFILLDTAGIKKKWKQEGDVGAAAAFQSIRTLDGSDVVLFTMDASEPLSAQDQIIANQILNTKKSCVLVLNKVDLLNEKQLDLFLDSLPNYFPQMWFLPVVLVSAKTSKNLDVLLNLSQQAFQSANRIIEADVLEKFLRKTLEEDTPGKMDDQRSPKFFGLTQLDTNPPIFRMSVNFPAAIATAWKKWFEKQFRVKFGFEGTPIEIKYHKKS